MFENPTANLSAIRNACAKIACCSSESIFTFLYAGNSTQTASEQFVSSNSTNKHPKQLGLEIQTALSR
jgi:hypothetical protein